MQMTVHVVAAGYRMDHNTHQIPCFSPPQSVMILVGEIMSLSSIAVVCKDME